MSYLTTLSNLSFHTKRFPILTSEKRIINAQHTKITAVLNKHNFVSSKSIASGKLPRMSPLGNPANNKYISKYEFDLKLYVLQTLCLVNKSYGDPTKCADAKKLMKDYEDIQCRRKFFREYH